MKIGHKIRQLREIKNLSQENMAEVLKMSINGYSKIERNEVDVNIEKLQQIAMALNIKPEEILAFDEKYFFNNHNNEKVYNHCTFSDDEKQLYKDKVRLLEDKVIYLEKEIARLTLN